MQVWNQKDHKYKKYMNGLTIISRDGVKSEQKGKES